MRRKLVIKGIVQGVGFRYFTSKTAKRFGITGFVRNQPDGSVYVEAQSARRTLDSFVEYLREGPTASTVNEIIETSIQEEPVENDFRIAL